MAADISCRYLQTHACMHITKNSKALAERTGILVPNQKLEANNNGKDIGVYIDHNLSFHKYISAICNKASSIFVVLKRNFPNLDKENFILLHKIYFQYIDKETFIIPYKSHLDYTSVVYSPFKIKHIEQPEQFKGEQRDKALGSNTSHTMRDWRNSSY